MVCLCRKTIRLEFYSICTNIHYIWHYPWLSVAKSMLAKFLEPRTFRFYGICPVPFQVPFSAMFSCPATFLSSYLLDKITKNLISFSRLSLQYKLELNVCDHLSVGSILIVRISK